MRVKCQVEKEVICDDCTEEDAKNNPFGYAINELEVNQTDWEVRSVEENK